MKVDLSKIPSVCSFQLMSNSGTSFGYICFLEETIRNKKMSCYGQGATPQEAVDNAVERFSS